DVGQADPDLLVLGEVYSRDACHSDPLSLALLVLGVLADDPHDALATHDLALRTNSAHGRTNLHFLNLSSPPYLRRYTIRPRLRSYGDSSTRTLSPGRMRMKCLRILPEMCASTLCLFSSSTWNMALGSVSSTVPVTSIASSFSDIFSL